MRPKASYQLLACLVFSWTLPTERKCRRHAGALSAMGMKSFLRQASEKKSHSKLHGIGVCSNTEGMQNIGLVQSNMSGATRNDNLYKDIIQ